MGPRPVEIRRARRAVAVSLPPVTVIGSSASKKLTDENHHVADEDRVSRFVDSLLRGRLPEVAATSRAAFWFDQVRVELIGSQASIPLKFIRHGNTCIQVLIIPDTDGGRRWQGPGSTFLAVRVEQSFNTCHQSSMFDVDS
jgi:hypothetical protein